MEEPKYISKHVQVVDGRYFVRKSIVDEAEDYMWVHQDFSGADVLKLPTFGVFEEIVMEDFVALDMLPAPLATEVKYMCAVKNWTRAF